MTMALLVLAALTFGATLQIWRFAWRRGYDSPLMFGLAFPAVAVWLMLMASGYGSQSPSNVAELFFLFAAGVALAYVHALLVSRIRARPRATALWMMLGLVIVAALLRTFMPLLPE